MLKNKMVRNLKEIVLSLGFLFRLLGEVLGGLMLEKVPQNDFQQLIQLPNIQLAWHVQLGEGKL